MRVVIIWRENSEYGREVEEWLREFKRRTGKELESYDPDEPDGESLVRTYDIVEYPTILALTDEEGRIEQGWRGRDLPRIDDVAAYMIEQ